jgi:hypothetical protein
MTDEKEEIADDIVYEEPERPSELIAASLNSFVVCDCYDYGMADSEEKAMIDDIKRMALVLVHTSLKNIYETNIEQEQ